MIGCSVSGGWGQTALLSQASVPCSCSDWKVPPATRVTSSRKPSQIPSSSSMSDSQACLCYLSLLYLLLLPPLWRCGVGGLFADLSPCLWLLYSSLHQLHLVQGWHTGVQYMFADEWLAGWLDEWIRSGSRVKESEAFWRLASLSSCAIPLHIIKGHT